MFFEHGFLVAVDDGGVFDVHGFTGVLEGVEAFLVVRLGGADAGDHVSVGVAAEAVLQDAGQLAVPEGNELLLVLVDGGQRRYNVPQLQ